MMETRMQATSMKAIVLAVIVAACVAVCLVLPSQAQAADLQAASSQTAVTQKSASTQKAKVYKIKTAAQWHKIGNYKGGTFKIMNNIKLTKTSQYLAINKSYKYTIDLNGKKVYTSYSGKEWKKRDVPLTVSKGTVVIKGNSKGKGVLRSTEFGTVYVTGTGKLYLKSGTINNDFLDYNMTSCCAIGADSKGKVVLKGGNVTGIVHGVYAWGNAKIYTTGVGTKTYPYIRGKDGCALAVAEKGVTLSLKGGSFGTAATPDYYGMAMSGWYPVLDVNGQSLKTAKNCKYADANGNQVKITTTLMGMSKRLTTSVKGKDGYYTVYVVKA